MNLKRNKMVLTTLTTFMQLIFICESELFIIFQSMGDFIMLTCKENILQQSSLNYFYVKQKKDSYNQIKEKTIFL